MLVRNSFPLRPAFFFPRHAGLWDREKKWRNETITTDAGDARLGG